MSARHVLAGEVDGQLFQLFGDMLEQPLCGGACFADAMAVAVHQRGHGLGLHRQRSGIGAALDGVAQGVQPLDRVVVQAQAVDQGQQYLTGGERFGERMRRRRRRAGGCRGRCASRPGSSTASRTCRRMLPRLASSAAARPSAA
ncbi:MAG: hypothetical protein ABT19_15000 [Rhodanobacter sp. SCN 68-63]|nr:MAG: hypothetical protein ABT19_15000 [Rhodanobacter sp. SCN 68-63]